MASGDSEAATCETLLNKTNTTDKTEAPEEKSLQSMPVTDWSWCGARLPKNQVTYMTQIILVYGIIAVSLSQIILQSSDRELWLVLLSTSIGYVLPSPRLKFLKPRISTFSSLTSAAATATTTTTSSSSSSSSLPNVNWTGFDVVADTPSARDSCGN